MSSGARVSAATKEQPCNSSLKQLFQPNNSSAPQGADIREKFKKISSSHSTTTHEPARTANASTVPSTSRSTYTKQPLIGGFQGQLQSLYAKTDSFKEDAGFADLMVPSSSVKIHESVYFGEDDFSDDENLDLDYEAPAALPRLSLNGPATQEKSIPSSSLTRAEGEIPWSQSPASHLLPPKAVSCNSVAKSPTLKRQLSGDDDTHKSLGQVAEKRRVLPASFHKNDANRMAAQDTGQSGRTSASKSRDFWDSSASTIEGQKNLHKNQRNSRSVQADKMPGSAQGLNEAGAIPAKPTVFSLSEEQKLVEDLVVNKHASVFFTGPAGAGKSVLMRSIISKLKHRYAKDPERVAITASTGLAACNIGGITLHSFAGIGLGKEDAPVLVKKVRRNPKARNRWLTTKCLIIDEVSMVDGELFDKLSFIGRAIRNNGRPWGGIQLVITGDFFQLPPVPDFEQRRSNIRFAFDANTWTTSIDHTIGLTQVFRQRDPVFANMLNEMRLGRISPSTEETFRALARPLNFKDGVESAELYPTRLQVESSNDKRLRNLPGKSYRYDAIDSGDPAIKDKLLANSMAPKSLELKVGAQVMLIKNLDETLVNGSLGKVVAFSDEHTFETTGVDSYENGVNNRQEDDMAKARRTLQVFSRDANKSLSNQRMYPVVQFVSTGGAPRVILCQMEEWKTELPDGQIQAKRVQLPLILAWALSIHKAQGQTLDRVTVNLGRVFEKGQAYVALSRATCQEGLRILAFDKSKVMAHERVIDFYKKLYSAEQANGHGSTTSRSSTIKGSSGKTTATAIDLDEEEAIAACGN